MDVSGTYELLDRCGTALGALHKRVSSNPADAPLYLFFDPTRNRGTHRSLFHFFSTSLAFPSLSLSSLSFYSFSNLPIGEAEDCFVFATNHRVLSYNEDRGSIAIITPSWRIPMGTSKSSIAEVGSFHFVFIFNMYIYIYIYI